MDKYKMFIPKDDKIKNKFMGFKVLFLFRSVPKKCKLLCVNVFTQKSIVKDRGFRFIAPWYRSRLVSVANRNIDYPKMEFITSDGIMVKADIAVTLNISDVEKFEFISNNPVQEYNVTVQDLLRRFVANRTTDELYTGEFQLRDLDPRAINSDGTVGKSRLETFEEQYGIQTVSLQAKEFKPPESILDDNQKKVVQDKENQRLLSDAENKLKIAEIEARTLAISSEAKAKAKKVELQAKIEVLKEKYNMDDEKIKEFLLADTFSNGTANVIASVGNNSTANVIAALNPNENAPKTKTLEK